MKRILQKLILSTLLLASTTTASYSFELNSDRGMSIGISNELSEIREMIELYVAIGIKLKYKNPKERLTKDIKKFDILIATLEKDFKDPRIQQNISSCKSGWQEIKEHVTTALTSSGKDSMQKEILFIHGNLFKVKKDLLMIKKSILSKLDPSAQKLIMACTVIGSAARTFSAHYYMDMWELKDPTISEHWKTAAKKYKSAIDTLSASSFAKDPNFKKMIDKSTKYLQIFTMLWELKKSDNHTPALISRKSNQAHSNAIEMEKIILSATPK